MFLKFLNSQVGTYGGIISHEKEPKTAIVENEQGEEEEKDLPHICEDKKFFSEWFLPDGYNEEAVSKGWGPETPWCACFASWGLINAGLSGPTSNPKWFENVDTFMKY